MNSLDLAIKTKNGIDMILRRSFEHVIARLLAFSFFVSLIPVVFLIGTSYLQGVVEQQDQSNMRIDRVLTRHYLLKNLVAEIKLCVKSKFEKNDLAEWYCSRAISYYERQSEHWPPEERKEILERKAIEAMLINSEYYLMVNQGMLEKAGESKSKEKVLLESLMNYKVMCAIIFSAFLVGLYVYYRFYKLNKLFSGVV